MIVVIDNYDSFTYNLVQAIAVCGRPDMIVVLNDQAPLTDIIAWNPSHLVISPGPCTPREAGISVDAIRHFAGKVPILGVCLGHQCIGQAFGAKVTGASRIMHGKTSPIHHVGNGIYAHLPNPFVAARYHSLMIEESTVPEEFEVTAWTDQEELMGIRHRRLPIEGVQFHPESFLTPEGHRLMEAFVCLKSAIACNGQR
jgi:anthranilate synthase/aminodeoxychorismate synthase-like glutamine amidotransferase